MQGNMGMCKHLAWLLACGALAAASPAQASDHIDGVKTAIDNAADITDVFAFVSPADDSKLVLVMNVHGLAAGVSRFSNAVDYKIRVRPIADAKALVPSPDPSKESSVVCTFSGGLPLVDATQHATCTLRLVDGTETVTFDTRGGTYRAGGEGWSSRGTRVFAGVRSDPWFLDLVKTVAVNRGKRIAPTGGVDGLWEQNVLSIVVEVDKSRLPGSLLAVTAQTVRK